MKPASTALYRRINNRRDGNERTIYPTGGKGTEGTPQQEKGDLAGSTGGLCLRPGAWRNRSAGDPTFGNAQGICKQHGRAIGRGPSKGKEAKAAPGRLALLGRCSRRVCRLCRRAAFPNAGGCHRPGGRYDQYPGDRGLGIHTPGILLGIGIVFVCGALAFILRAVGKNRGQR